MSGEVKLIGAQDRKASVDSDGVVTLTRYMQFEADDISDIPLSNLLPVPGSSHPTNVEYRLKSVDDISINGNKDRRVQALAQLTYVKGRSRIVVPGSGSGARDPWDLGAQNVSLGHVDVQRPMLFGLDRDGDRVKCVNTAGCVIDAEWTDTITELAFTFYSRRQPKVARNAIINSSQETVAGFTIGKWMGKLYPMSETLIIDYDSDGSETRRYWQVDVRIQVNYNTWELELLNVGTMARFDDKLGNIYRYTPWTSSDASSNMNIEPKYGSIDDVMKAQKEYMDKTGETSTRIPYEEITEPMPLDEDGGLDENAIKNPSRDNWSTIRMFDCAIGSWNAFNLPKKAGT